MRRTYHFFHSDVCIECRLLVTVFQIEHVVMLQRTNPGFALPDTSNSGTRISICGSSPCGIVVTCVMGDITFFVEVTGLRLAFTNPLWFSRRLFGVLL